MEIIRVDENLKILCRLCLVYCKENHINIFKNKCGKSNITLANAIEGLISTSNFQLKEGDGLSEIICLNCNRKLTDSYNFCQEIIKTFQQFTNLTKPDKKRYPLKINSTSSTAIDENFIITPVNNTIKEESVDVYVIRRIQNENTSNKNIASKQSLLEHTEKINIEQNRRITTTKLPNEKTRKSILEDRSSDAVDFLIHIDDDKAKLLKKGINSTISYENRKYICKICGKKFIKNTNLADHLRLHGNVKNFKCPYCSKAFVQVSNYRCHLRVHTKERPYKCSICPKTFTQASALKIHVRSHTNEKIYVCDICQKGFTNFSDLKKHKLIHDPVKKFKCDVCAKTFRQKSHLKTHIQSKKYQEKKCS